MSRSYSVRCSERLLSLSAGAALLGVGSWVVVRVSSGDIEVFVRGAEDASTTPARPMGWACPGSDLGDGVEYRGDAAECARRRYDYRCLLSYNKI